MDPTLSKSRRQEIRARLLATTHEHPWRGPITLSERSLRRWCANFSKDRLPGLVAKRRNDNGRCRVIPAEAVESAQKLLEEEPRRTVATLVDMLLERKPEWKGLLSRSTLDRHLRRLGKPMRKKSDAYLSFEAADPDDLWQGDILHGSMALHEGKEVKAISVACQALSFNRRFYRGLPRWLQRRPWPGSSFDPKGNAMQTAALRRPLQVNDGIPPSVQASNCESRPPEPSGSRCCGGLSGGHGCHGTFRQR